VAPPVRVGRRGRRLRGQARGPERTALGTGRRALALVHRRAGRYRVPARGHRAHRATPVAAARKVGVCRVRSKTIFQMNEK